MRSFGAAWLASSSKSSSGRSPTCHVASDRLRQIFGRIPTGPARFVALGEELPAGPPLAIRALDVIASVVWGIGRTTPVLDRVGALVAPTKASCIGRVPSVDLETPAPITASVRCLPVPIRRLVTAEEGAIAVRAQADHRLNDEPRLLRRISEDRVLVRHEWAELPHPWQLLDSLEDVEPDAVGVAQCALVDVLQLSDRRHEVRSGLRSLLHRFSRPAYRLGCSSVLGVTTAARELVTHPVATRVLTGLALLGDPHAVA